MSFQCAIHRCWAGGLILSLALCARVSSQESSSLADIARKTRQEHDQLGAKPANQSQRLASQLEEQQEEAAAAPPGFMPYNAGVYRLVVPAQSEVEGRDSNGALLAPPSVTTKVKVYVGEPLPIGPALSDKDVFQFLRSFAGQYSSSSSASCSQEELNHQRAYRCFIPRGRVLDTDFHGTVYFVVGSNSAVPVICMNPELANEHLIYGNPRASYKEKQAAYAAQAQRFQDERNSFITCDTVFKSIRLKEEPQSFAKFDSSSKEKKVTPAIATSGKVTPNPLDTTAPSVLAEVARQSRDQAKETPKPRISLDEVSVETQGSPGYKKYELAYCKKPECWYGSLQAPKDLPLFVDSYANVFFQVELGKEWGQIFIVDAGIYDAANPGTINRTDVRMPKYDYYRVENKILGAENSKIGPWNARVTTRLIVRAPGNAIEQTTAITAHDTHFSIVCSASEAKFSSLKPICDDIISSLKLP